jgi:beta-lactamase class A
MSEANRITRRGVAGLAVALSTGVQGSGAVSTNARLQAIEERAGGRLGVFALDTADGRSLTWRPDDRFLMCSTFKLLAAAAVLARVDARRENPNRLVPFSALDLVEPHPVTGANVEAGALSLRKLCEAAVKDSDSTAANLLLRTLGGPPALTGFMRSLGDGVTRQDRYELAANSAAGLQDTTSPRAMAHSVRKLLVGGALRADSSQALEAWMCSDRRGSNRIRAGVPETWVCGSKPGTSATSLNDVAILRPPQRAPVIVAAYYRSAPADIEPRERVLQEVGRSVAQWIAGRARTSG